MEERPKIRRIDHVAIVVTDLSASKEWYMRMFGFDALDGGANPNSPYVGNAVTKLALLQSPNAAQFKPPLSQGPRACHFAFDTDGDTFGEYQSRLTDMGMSYEKLIHSDCQSIYFSDPDGYMVEVTTYELS